MYNIPPDSMLAGKANILPSSDLVTHLESIDLTTIEIHGERKPTTVPPK